MVRASAAARLLAEPPSIKPVTCCLHCRPPPKVLRMSHQPDRAEDKEDDADNGARNALHQSDDEHGAPKAKLYRSLPDQVSLAITIIIIIIIVTKF